MLTIQEEDQIAKTLSSLTPLEYEMLMKKVKRHHWTMIGLKYNWMPP